MMVMMLSGKKLHTPTPYPGRYLPPKRRHLGGDLLCVQGAEIEAKRKHEKEEENCHAQETERGGHTPNRRAPPWPLGGCAIGSQETQSHVHT